MPQSCFTLIPFSKESLCPALQSLQVMGAVERQQDRLTLQFELAGDLSVILLTEPNPNPQRLDNLWQQTCFEFFLGLPANPQYWEVNLSPSGDWNMYRFRDYRQGMAQESTYTELPFHLGYPQPDSLALQVHLDLAAIVPGGQPLDLGVTMVILDHTQTQSYWALAHPGPEADFHRRDGFMIRV